MYWNESAFNGGLYTITGLTLTWDVLKWKIQAVVYNKKCRLTLTWDVLK